MKNRLFPQQFIVIFNLIVVVSLYGLSTNLQAGVDSAVSMDPPRDYLARGQKEMLNGQIEGAIAEWKLALVTAQKAGEENKAIDLHGNLASAYLRRGNYTQAITHLDSALRLANKHENLYQQAQLKRQLGTTYLAGGHVDKAQQQLKQSLDLAEQIRKPGLIAAAYNDLGNLLMHNNLHREALLHYKKSVDIAQTADLSLLVMKVSTNVVAAEIEVEQYEQARNNIKHAKILSEKLDNSHDNTMQLLRLGDLSLNLYKISKNPADKAEAYALFNKAKIAAKNQSDNHAGAYALGYLGALYENEGRNEDALRLSQRAIFLAREASAPESLYQWQWQAAHLLYKQGEQHASLVHYRQAIASLDQIRSEFLMQQSSTGGAFSLKVAPLYRQYVTLLIDLAMSANNPEDKNRYLWEVQEAMESFKAAELQDYFKDDCVVAAQKKVQRIDKKLAPTTAVIYPIILAEKIVLLLTFASDMETVSVEIDENQLNSEIAAFRHKLEKRTTREYLHHSKKLYSWLVQPIEKILQARDIDTLVIVPGGALRTIPIAALHDGNQFLIEKYAISTTPGLELTDPRPINRENIKLLLSGITQPRAGFGGLPHVNAELDAIQKRYGGLRLQDDAFITDAIKQELEREDYTIVHIASHGKFEAHIEDSFILTFDGRLKLNDLERFMSVSRYRDKPIELLTLSACQTAVGDDRAALGLAGIAVKAGVRSALASLWYINDAATAQLVDGFYAAMQNPSLTKARSLQQAQINMLKDLRYRHPGYWSAFLLIGNWL
jgi:CHAT domain-containing protein